MSDRSEIEALIERVASGERAAFGQLYDRTSAKLYGVCLRILSNRGEAEEALQDVYVRVWHNAGRYRVNGLSPMTWLITIARNRSIDLLRARGGASGRLGTDEAEWQADPAPGPEAQAIAEGEARRIAGCLGELQPDRAAAVRGAYLEGASYADLARRFDVPLNTMRTWLRRSLLRLKDCMSR